MDGMQIGSIILMSTMAFMLFRRIGPTMRETRKGTKDEWINFALILGVVALFVLFLMKSV